jgi:hypothetical protein
MLFPSSQHNPDVHEPAIGLRARRGTSELPERRTKRTNEAIREPDARKSMPCRPPTRRSRYGAVTPSLARQPASEADASKAMAGYAPTPKTVNDKLLQTDEVALPAFRLWKRRKK